jgi:hypothetical protein
MVENIVMAIDLNMIRVIQRVVQKVMTLEISNVDKQLVLLKRRKV